jgi:hypothetical protein
MRVFVIHNQAGDILSISAPSEELRGQVTILPGEGELVAEVDTAEAGIPEADGKSPDAARDVARAMKSYRVVGGKLAKKG